MTKVNGYQPTTEQINAAKARREQQQAEKAARQNKSGGKTVKSKDGTYKSVTVTPKQVEAKRNARAEQAAKQKKGSVTVFDKKTGKYISETADEAAKKAAKEAAEETAKKSNKLKMFTKMSPKLKKFGLIGLATSALLGLGAYLYTKLTDKEQPAQKSTAPENPEVTTPATPGNKEPENPEATTPATLGNKEPEKPVATAPTTPDNKEPEKPGATTPTTPDNKEPGKPAQANNEYTVKKGDCVWNIAKQHLKELKNDPNYKPTDAEILKHTKELMELNKLQFEEDGYHVLIKPNDKLKLVA